MSTIRGSGQQKMGAYVNLGAYYLMGIPTAVLLAFVLHMEGKVTSYLSNFFFFSSLLTFFFNIRFCQ